MGGEVNQDLAGAAEPGVAIDRLALYAEIAEIAAQAASRARFLRESLRALATAFGAPHALLYSQFQMDVVEESFTAEGSDPSFWKPALDGILTGTMSSGGSIGRLFRARDSGLLLAGLAAPLRDASAESVGAIALVVPCGGVSVARQLQALLESCAHLVSCYSLRFERKESRLDPMSAMRAAMDLGRVAGFSSLRELAFAITNNLRNVASVDQTALGIARGPRVEVLSLSGYDEVKVQSEGVRTLTSAMEECLDAGVPIVWQRAGEGDWSKDDGRADWKLHRRWSETAGNSAVASFPIGPVAGATVIVSVRRESGAFSREELDVMRRTVEPYVGAFGLVDRASRSLPTHARDAARDSIGWLRAPSHQLRRAVAVTGLLVFLWICFGHIPYTISAPTLVVPAEVQQLGAPFEGTLESAGAVAGDVVQKGAVLARFRTGELLLDRDRLQAELQVQKYAAGQAMAQNGSPVEVRLAQAQQQLLESQLALVDQRIEAATLRAPFDGIVVSGDLRTRIGQAFPLGEPLFQVAPEGRWKLHLQVPEQAVDDVVVGQTGTFATDARPDQPEAFEIHRVSPGSEVSNGQNVYVAEADVEIAAPWMRPGMDGIGKIAAGDKAMWWVLLHRLTDWLRLNFWL